MGGDSLLLRLASVSQHRFFHVLPRLNHAASRRMASRNSGLVNAWPRSLF
jgi:hypothetical protein